MVTFLDQKVKRILIWEKQNDLKLQIKLKLILKNIMNNYFALQTLAQPMRNVLRTLLIYVSLAHRARKTARQRFVMQRR